MIATAAAGKMIALPKLANRSALTRPSKTAPACDGAPIKAMVAATSSATASQLMRPDPRRPANAATIIRIVPPIDRISSGRMGAKRPISAPPPLAWQRPARASAS